MTKLPFWPNNIKIEIILNVYIHFYKIWELVYYKISSSHNHLPLKRIPSSESFRNLRTRGIFSSSHLWSPKSSWDQVNVSISLTPFNLLFHSFLVLHSKIVSGSSTSRFFSSTFNSFNGIVNTFLYQCTFSSSLHETHNEFLGVPKETPTSILEYSRLWSL